MLCATVFTTTAVMLVLITTKCQPLTASIGAIMSSQGWHSLPAAPIRAGEDPAVTAVHAWPHIIPKKAELIDAVPVSCQCILLFLPPHASTSCAVPEFNHN